MVPRGEHRFSPLMKRKKKWKNYAVFDFAGKRFFFYIYDVITWEIFLKRSMYHYLEWQPLGDVRMDARHAD